MNWKTWIPLVFAVLLAVVAAKLTHDVIAGKKSGNTEAQGNFVQVVVARGDLPPGAELTADNLTLAPMPGKTPPAHTYTATTDLVGRVSAEPLVQGQPINEQLLSPKGSGSGLQALVPAGMRAVTIEVNEFTGIAGLLNPGMNVDVVSTFRDDVSRETVTRTIVQDVKVLAVGPRITPPAEDQKDMYHSVTLLAKPHDAERIELAAFSGHPRLSLRSGRDNYTVASRGTNLSELATGDSSDGGNGLLASFVKTMARNARAAAATTQPSNVEADKTPATPVSDPFGGEQQPRTMQRKVTVIRNGVETTTVFEVPRTYSIEDLMTGTASERAPIEPK